MENQTVSHLLLGFTKVKIVAISPDLEWLQENYDPEAEEPSYIIEGRGKDTGKKKIIIDVYLKNAKEDIFKYSIWLTEEDEIANSGAFKWINNVGTFQWAKTEDQLFDSFKYYEDITWKDGKPLSKEITGNKEYRIAKKGENDLNNLMKFLNPINTFLDLDKLFQGDFKELQDNIKEDIDFHAVALIYVTEKLEQRAWKEFLPLKILPEINNGMNISKYNKKTYDKFVEGLSYLKGYYYLGRLRQMQEGDIPENKEIDDTDDNY